MAPPLRNEYWLLRHGRSLANEVEIVVSKLENGVKEEWTLAAAGVEQAAASGRVFGEHVRGRSSAAGGAGPRVVAYASPFSRTLKTARTAIAAAGLDGIEVQVAPELRERFFGEALELQSYGKAYGTTWEQDAATGGAYRPGGDGESVQDVSARLKALFERLEATHDGAVVLLVSHGDTLSIMQGTMTDGGVNAPHHRRFAFETAELRALPVPVPVATSAQAALGAQAAAE